VDPFASATELLVALAAGRVTSGELTDLYIRRIERHETEGYWINDLLRLVLRDRQSPECMHPPASQRRPVTTT
jgi:Asp-tRNA(Asn)/Glu-tRNA(Gln) amidotransferase A subunit family amidase